jgi:hypothetical protein
VVEVTLSQPLWSQWVVVAVEQRDAASLARSDLIRDWGGPNWNLPAQRELRASMQSVAAAAFAVEGWGFATLPLLGTDKTLGAGGVIGIMKRHYRPPRRLRKEIDQRLNRMFELRGGLVHHKAKDRPGVVHPVLGSTPYESATYTYEATVDACETLRMLVDLTLQHPHPDQPPSRDVVGHAQMLTGTVRW